VVNLIPGVIQALLGPFTSWMLGLAFDHGVARDEEHAEDLDDGEPAPAPV
jgi:hypothetical protein